MKDYFKANVSCPYYSKCKSRGLLCANCKHNKNRKEDHYEPVNPTPMRPWSEPPSFPPRVYPPYTQVWWS